ncbi:MAG: KUP/HAK/KT family potassium transporter, partial [Candidatus Eremiobacteraeota bacterium]|nr:KUP/HAK/KT family potassium transporter [Candidatus Eremiobacteraeota bacterium]
PKRKAKSDVSAFLALGALGIVFGDIGTSPLYAFQQCFLGDASASVTTDNIYGICSLIFWALVIVVSIKYVTFLLRADYDGQGGTLALLAQLTPVRKSTIPAGITGIAVLVLFGSAMLYGDGVITPAISVVSAIEGLDTWTTAAHPYIVPLSMIVLLGLFALQPRGTAGIGKLFGPVMVLWFTAIGLAGAVSIAHHPQILAALNPVHSWAFFLRHGFRSFLIFGAVVLCLTGAEALYADLAHFGRKPITLAWYCVVMPALVLNYFGQGALTLVNPKVVSASFYALFPHWAIIPMVLLATAATIIASQALISGVFSLTQQAMQLGYTPRFRIVHTSRHYAGQIYMPALNVLLAIVCLTIIATFRSSNALGGAYGLAVTVTMITTTIAFARLLRVKWRWPLWGIVLLIGLFLSWDIPFLTGNLYKVTSGGWLPLLIATCLFTVFVTWNRGRRRLMEALFSHAMPIEQFLRETRNAAGHAAGTSFFLSPDSQNIPFALRHQWLRNHIANDTVVLLSIVNASRPYVHADRRVQIEEVAPRLMRIRAFYGFMQEPRINDILHQLRKHCPGLDLSQPTYYLASPKIVADTSEHALPAWQRNSYYWMTRIARPLTDSLGIPPNSIVEFGVEARI